MSGLAAQTAAMLERVRARRPRVHCITNDAAHYFTADVLLALGAEPSLTLAPDEIAAFVASADALLVNLGTLDQSRLKAIDIALDTAQAYGIPFVFDPVFIDRSEPRSRLARDIASRSPAVVRANAAEARLLAGADGEDAWRQLARNLGTVVAVTGEEDVVTDGSGVIRLANGDRLMQRLTAMGCGGSAIVAAFVGIETDILAAAAAALLVTGVAGEIAALHARGPGSFRPAFLDALYELDGPTISARARIEEVRA